jgi:hypothetical protein
VAIEDDSHGVTITFSAPDAVLRQDGPRIDGKLVGVFSTTGQTIEDRYGDPISVDADIHGAEYSQRVPGPLATLQSGKNVVTWRVDDR